MKAKTTVEINEDVLRRAREFAARHHRQLDSVVEDALREKLGEERKPNGAISPYRMEVSNAGGGPRPGVNLDKTSELLEL